jgi:hypothetical protein
MCAPNDFQVIQTMEDVSLLRPYDVEHILKNISTRTPSERIKREITSNWKHFKLKVFFSESTAASITLTLADIEKIDGLPLPKSARKNKDWWYPRSNCNMMAEAWLTEGYSMVSLDLDKGKVIFKRDSEGMSKLVVPTVLTSGKLPDNAVYELETHMEYIIKKYGLSKQVT